MRRFTVAILVCGVAVQSALAHTPSTAASDASCVNDPSWMVPQEPFRIHGNTWHVGPHGLGVFLVTAATGHVLIDGGVPGNAPLIATNIQRLGIDLHDIKWILSSHAHCDHAGGTARLARETGAQVIASAADARMLASGGHDDPQYGDRFPFAPVHVTRTAADGETLRLGDLSLTAHLTPGHTKGNTTWTWISCEGTRCLHMVDVGSLSAPGYALVNNPKYPDIAKDFDYSFNVIEALSCDIALAPHPGMVDFWERVAKRNQGDADALVDPALCRTYAKNARRDFEDELTKQRRAAASER